MEGTALTGRNKKKERATGAMCLSVGGAGLVTKEMYRQFEDMLFNSKTHRKVLKITELIHKGKNQPATSLHRIYKQSSRINVFLRPRSSTFLHG